MLGGAEIVPITTAIAKGMAVNWAATATMYAAAATAASAGYGAYTSGQRGKQQSAIAKYNAEMTRRQTKQQAAQREQAGKYEKEQILEHRKRVLSSIRAKYGKSGVASEGTPLLVELDAAETITMDALMAEYNTKIGVQNIRSQGEQEWGLYRMKAKSARQAGRLGVGESLFSGASQMANIGMQYKLMS